MHTETDSMMPGGRLLVLDRLKGLCLFLMMVFESAGYFGAFGPLHTFIAGKPGQDNEILPGLDVTDCMLPLFLFLIGMSCYLSFTRRARAEAGAAAGVGGAYRHFALRYLVFISLGSALVSVERLIKGKRDPIPGLQAICIVLLLSGIALVLCRRLCGKQKNCDKMTRIVWFVFYLCVVTLVVLELPLMICDVLLHFTFVGPIFALKRASYMHWSILHVVGFAGLVSLLFIRMKPRARVISLLALATVRYGLQYIPLLQQRRSTLVLGGPLGVFGWTLCLVGGFILCEAYVHAKRPRWMCLLVFVGLTAAAIPASILQPISSRGASVNFILLVGAAFTLFLWLVSLFDNVRLSFDLFAVWGKSPILIYIVAILFALILKLWDPVDAPLWAALTFDGGCFGILFGLAVWLHRTHKIVKI